jgi:hypothetical protein
MVRILSSGKDPWSKMVDGYYRFRNFIYVTGELGLFGHAAQQAAFRCIEWARTQQEAKLL